MAVRQEMELVSNPTPSSWGLLQFAIVSPASGQDVAAGPPDMNQLLDGVFAFEM